MRLIKIYVLIGLILILFSMTGCSDNEYSKFTSDFYNTYFVVADSINLKDTIGTLKSLESKENRDNLNKLNELLENIKEKVPKDREQHYKKLSEWYNEMVTVSEAYKNWNELSPAERADITGKIVNIDIRKKNWNNKSSNIIW